MEYSCFCTGARRCMSSGNHNLYKTGVVHMDRVMQEHDFIYLLEGEWEIEQNRIMYTMRPDDILILHAGEHHGGRVPCSDGTHTMYLHIEARPDDRFSLSGAKGKTGKGKDMAADSGIVPPKSARPGTVSGNSLYILGKCFIGTIRCKK